MQTDIFAKNDRYTVIRHFTDENGNENTIYFQVWENRKVIETFGSAVWLAEWMEVNMPDQMRIAA